MYTSEDSRQVLDSTAETLNVAVPDIEDDYNAMESLLISYFKTTSPDINLSDLLNKLRGLLPEGTKIVLGFLFFLR